MAQDIRELMKRQPSQEPSLPTGHEARFEARLQEAFGNENTTNSGRQRPLLFWMKIAAVDIERIATGKIISASFSFLIFKSCISFVDITNWEYTTKFS